MKTTLALLACTLVAPSCGGGDAPPPRELEDVVLTTFYPATYFAERIAGDHVPVECPLPAGADPIFWSPPREVVQRFQAARLVVVNGASFEKWVETVSLPASRTVDASAGFSDRFLQFEEQFVHSHGPAGEHTHEGIDGHTWLAPSLAILQARAIRDGLAEAFPDHAATYDENLDGLVADLQALGERARALGERLADVRLLASHPAYEYLAREAGWEVVNLDFDPAAPLSSLWVTQLREAMDGSSGAVLLWESTPLDATVETLADVHHVKSVVFSPGETGPGESADYIALMNANLTALESAL